MLKGLLYLLVVQLAICCFYKGEKYENGDTWVARSTFVLQCEIHKGGWRTKVVGCRTDNGVELKAGQTLHEGSTKYECVQAENGRVEIRRTLNVDVKSKKKDCGGHAVGDSWIAEKNFVQKCTENGIRITDCLTDAGIPVPLNGTLLLSGITYNCVQHGNGTVTIHRDVAPQQSNMRPTTERPVEVLGPMFKGFHNLGEVLELSAEKKAPVEVMASGQMFEKATEVVCEFEGERHKAGDIWVSDKIFTKKCTDDGAVIILNCIVDEKTIINVDTNLTVGKKTHRCYRKKEENRVYYEVRSN